MHADLFESKMSANNYEIIQNEKNLYLSIYIYFHTHTYTYMSKRKRACAQMQQNINYQWIQVQVIKGLLYYCYNWGEAWFFPKKLEKNKCPSQHQQHSLHAFRSSGYSLKNLALWSWHFYLVEQNLSKLP